MSTWINLIVFTLFAAGVYLVIYLRNRRNKKKSSSYLKILVTQGPDMAEVNAAVTTHITSMPLTQLSTPGILMDTTYGDLGKYKVQYQKKIDRDRLFLVTEAYSETKSPTGVMHRFIIRQNADSIEVLSDVSDTPADKQAKLDFARELFQHLIKGMASGRQKFG